VVDRCDLSKQYLALKRRKEKEIKDKYYRMFPGLKHEVKVQLGGFEEYMKGYRERQ
jgi:hypothetical protein